MTTTIVQRFEGTVYARLRVRDPDTAARWAQRLADERAGDERFSTELEPDVGRED